MESCLGNGGQISVVQGPKFVASISERVHFCNHPLRLMMLLDTALVSKVTTCMVQIPLLDWCRYTASAEFKALSCILVTLFPFLSIMLTTFIALFL